MAYILNSFSLNMLAETGVSVTVREISLSEAKKHASKMESAVGHADTAAVFSTVLGIPVVFNRTTVSLKIGETALVGQYRGPRLPEGSTILPEGAAIQWLLVTPWRSFDPNELIRLIEAQELVNTGSAQYWPQVHKEKLLEYLHYGLG